VVPKIDAPTGTVLTDHRRRVDGRRTGPTIQGTATYTVGSTYKADLFATGRFLYIKISSSSRQEWRLRSLDLDVEMLGAY
jgi:hypothetical protein